jgi:hypothetical protein
MSGIKQQYVPRRFAFASFRDLPWFVPNPWTRRGKEEHEDYSDTLINVIEYEVGWFMRVFITLEYPNSNKISRLYHYISVTVITLCVAVGYLSSMSSYQYSPTVCSIPACNNHATLCPGKMVCEPEPIDIFRYLDFSFFLFYMMDMTIRFSIAPFMPERILRIVPETWQDDMQAKAEKKGKWVDRDPNWGPVEKFVRYVLRMGNIIDIFATAPYLVLVLIHFVNQEFNVIHFTTSTSAVMTVRVARCFRLLKSLDMNPSGGPKLSLLVRTFNESMAFLRILVGFIIISAIIWGALIFTVERGNYVVSTDYPDGAFVRSDVAGEGTEISPFKNLGSSMYWGIVTMTTLGYGDMYPTSTAGRCIGAVCSIYGVIVISLPVTIINNSFQIQIEKYEKAAADEKAKIRLKKEVRLMKIASNISAKMKSSTKVTTSTGADIKKATQPAARLSLSSLFGISAPKDPEPAVEVSTDLPKELSVGKNGKSVDTTRI